MGDSASYVSNLNAEKLNRRMWEQSCAHRRENNTYEGLRKILKSGIALYLVDYRVDVGSKPAHIQA